MSIYDVLMLALVFAAIGFGAWKGLAWQIASFASIVISYLVALNFSNQLAAMLQIQPPWNRLVAMLALFLGTSLAIWIVFGRIKHLIKNWNMGGFDRQAGALLGAFKGVLICMVVTLFSVSLLGNQAAEAICGSRTGGYIVQGIDQLTAIVPQEIHEILKPHLEEFREGIAHEGHNHSSKGIPLQSQVFGSPTDESKAFPSLSGEGQPGAFEVPGSFHSNDPPAGLESFAGRFLAPSENTPTSNNGQSMNHIIGDVLDNVFDSAKSQFKNSAEDTANRWFNGQSNR